MNNSHKQIPGPVDHIEPNIWCARTSAHPPLFFHSLLFLHRFATSLCELVPGLHLKWQSKASSMSRCASNLLRFNEWKLCFDCLGQLKLNLNGAYVCKCPNRLIHQHLLEFPWIAGQTFRRKMPCFLKSTVGSCSELYPPNGQHGTNPSTITFTCLLTVAVGHDVRWCIVNLACFGKWNEQCNTKDSLWWKCNPLIQKFEFARP